MQPSELDSSLVALSSSSFDQTNNLPVPSSDHAEVPGASISTLLLDPDLAVKPSLRSRNDLQAPSRFRSPSTSSRSSSQLPGGNVARAPSKTGEAVTVRLFHVLAGSIGTTICGGKIGSSGLQACVSHVPFGSTSCYIRSHATKEPILSDDTLYIRTPFVADHSIIASLFSFPQSSSFFVRINTLC